MGQIRGVVFIGVVIFLNSATSAFGENLNKKLDGVYEATQSIHCVTVQDGEFDNKLAPYPPDAFVYHRNMTSIGELHFNGDGTSSLRASVLMEYLEGVSLPILGSAASVVVFECKQGSYEVFSDGSFVQYHGICDATIEDPAVIPPFTFTLENAVIRGRIGPSGKILMLYDADSNVETTKKSSSICGRSGLAIKK